MLFWALFTLGFIAGVFITLYVTSDMEEVNIGGIRNSVKTKLGLDHDHWQLYSGLVKINANSERFKKHRIT